MIPTCEGIFCVIQQVSVTAVTGFKKITHTATKKQIMYKKNQVYLEL